MNVDSAERVRNTILDSMVGVFVVNHKYTKNNQVNSLAAAAYVSVDGAKVEIDQKQLYQQLLVAGIGFIECQTLFQYELFSYPTFLFYQMLLMRIADIAKLQNSIVKRVQSCVDEQFPS